MQVVHNFKHLSEMLIISGFFMYQKKWYKWYKMIFEQKENQRLAPAGFIITKNKIYSFDYGIKNIVKSQYLLIHLRQKL